LFYSPVSCQLYLHVHVSQLSNLLEGSTHLMQIFELTSMLKLSFLTVQSGSIYLI